MLGGLSWEGVCIKNTVRWQTSFYKTICKKVMIQEFKKRLQRRIPSVDGAGCEGMVKREGSKLNLASIAAQPGPEQRKQTVEGNGLQTTQRQIRAILRDKCELLVVWRSQQSRRIWDLSRPSQGSIRLD